MHQLIANSLSPDLHHEKTRLNHSQYWDRTLSVQALNKMIVLNKTPLKSGLWYELRSIGFARLRAMGVRHLALLDTGFQ